MNVKINTVARALPEYSRTTADILPLLDTWLQGQDDRFIRKVKKLFKQSGVARRYSFLAPDVVFSLASFEQRNEIYKREAIRLGTLCLRDALQSSGWAAEDLDYIITVSCTGIMIPSIDAYLVNNLQLKQNIVRLPVTEMGCAAGISGIIYAKRFLESQPGKRAAVVAVESPICSLQVHDFSMTNMVSAALFGDGAACVLLSSDVADSGPTVIDEEMYHFDDSERLMGFDLKDSGLKMVLAPEVPQVIAAHLEAIIYPFLEKNNCTINDIDHLIFHPGGKKIIQRAEAIFGSMGKDLTHTREVMRQFGNMSSVTVLYVLAEFLKQRPLAGARGLMLSFGPGFSAQKVLLQW